MEFNTRKKGEGLASKSPLEPLVEPGETNTFICYRGSSLVFNQNIHFISIIVFLLILILLIILILLHLILILIVFTITIAIIILFPFIMFSYTASVGIQKCGRRAYGA
ncbi:hypothetical protein PPACK8108_LOCUS1210, partial [Phakopsora pachyrhizi]